MALTSDIKLVLLAVNMVMTVSLTSGGVIKLDEANALQLKPKEDSFDSFYRYFLEIIKPPTVLHFAKHTLCKGQIDMFEVAMRRVLKMDESFVRKFVYNLCEKKPPAMLKLWTSELFDSDGDGFISDHEKRSTFDNDFDD